MKHAVAGEAAKAAPAVAVAAWTLNDTVMAFTLGYIVLQAAYLAWKWWRESKRKE